MAKDAERGWTIERLRMIMQGEPHNPDEAWGVLNPATCRGRDGELYIFPRVVAAGNYPRIDVSYGMADARIGAARIEIT